MWAQVDENLAVIKNTDAYAGDGADLADDAKALWRKTHQTIRKVTSDIEHSWQFNTAIAAVMELSNLLGDCVGTVAAEATPVLKFALESMVRLLGPVTPHIAEELWQRMGHEGGIIAAGWPSYLEAACAEDVIELAVQVNGKVRGHITVAAGTDPAEIETLSLADAKVQRAIGEATVRKVIVVQNRLVNIVAK